MNLRNILIVVLLASAVAVGFSFLTPKVNSTAKAKTENKAAVKDHPAAKRNFVSKSPTKKTATMEKKTSGPKPGSPLEAGDLSWLHIQDAGELANKEGKKYFIDVYTDWCGWCKVMDRQTFSDPEIQKYLNDNFHVIKFNAEQKEAIRFEGESYEWISSGRKGVNKLAIKFLGNRLSYPSLVYLDENKNLIQVSRGFKKPEQFLSELKMING